MSIKIITIPILAFLFLGCKETKVSYHITERDLPFDTILIVKNIEKYTMLRLTSKDYWNDTIIYGGYKMPSKKSYFRGSTENFHTNDTMKISIDKYKATKVDIYVEYEF